MSESAATLCVRDGPLTASELVAIALVRIAEDDEIQLVVNGSDSAVDNADYTVGYTHEPKAYRFGRHIDSTDRFDTVKAALDGEQPPAASRYTQPLRQAGHAWLHLGEYVLAALNVPTAVHATAIEMVYRHVIAEIESPSPAVARARTALHRALPVVAESDRIDVAMVLASILLRALISKVVVDAVAWDADIEVVSTEHAAAVTASAEFMVLPRPSLIVNAYLRDADPRQTIKFIVFPTADDRWVIHTVDYCHQRFQTYVPIVATAADPGVCRVHRHQHRAVVASLETAIDVVHEALEEYYAPSNFYSRMRRWLFSA